MRPSSPDERAFPHGYPCVCMYTVHCIMCVCIVQVSMHLCTHESVHARVCLKIPGQVHFTRPSTACPVELILRDVARQKSLWGAEVEEVTAVSLATVATVKS